LYTHLVKKGVITLEKLIEMMSINPRKRFNFDGGLIEDGQPADLTLLDLDRQWVIDPKDFASMGKATPFAGWTVCGKPVMTIVNGEIIYEETNTESR
ncbi:MAG: amidohydrolase family protein, partial [Emergencia sp.]